MDFDWLDTAVDLKSILPKEIEESFEDPFSLRLLPESGHFTTARYYNLGKTMAARPLFSVFWTDGKSYRVIFCREMCPEELHFYHRKNAETL